MPNRRQRALKEIASWSIDAKLEDNERYFYKTFEVDMLLNGDKSYVIGRKGTGKTAIAKFLKSHVSYDFFAQDISLKNFPFNELYSLKDSAYTNPNEYITIWKYIIYMELLSLMRKNQALSPTFRKDIESILPKKPTQGFLRRIKNITSKTFNLDAKILSYSQDSEYIKEELSWIEKVDVLEDLILNNIDRYKYFIIFDELDEDYSYQSAIEPTGEYLNLISGLFKAVQYIKSLAFESNLKINPVIFLRDDIYSLIKDNDKNKWSDLEVNLSWTQNSIQPLLAHRLSRAFDQHSKSESHNFGQIWSEIFSKEAILYGKNRKKKITIYDWITRESLLRPRDYVKYIQLCAKKVYESNHSHIYPTTVTTQDILYSRYFRSELTDEVHSLMPDIDVIFDIFSKIGKAYLNISDFKTMYDSYIEQGKLKNDTNYMVVLEILFNFSIIGNCMRNSDKEVFRYINSEASLNFDLPITLHRGLHKSLQLF